MTLTAATIDRIGEDLLQNIAARLPATSFAAAACVSRSWNTVCNRVLSRPKLSSACSFEFDLETAVEEVLNKVLSEPIRPQFAIVSIANSFNLDECYQLITTALGSQVPVVINRPRGIIGRDASSDEFTETLWKFKEDYHDGVMLVVGFLPGLKVRTIPLLYQHQVYVYQKYKEPQIEKFVVDIKEFSTSVSGHESPAAIIMFGDCPVDKTDIMEKLDYAMSPETIIVGDGNSLFQHINDDIGIALNIYSAVAMVFAVDRNKPPGTVGTQFHAVLSNGLSPVGPTYTVTSVIERYRGILTCFTARREGARDNTPSETILSQVYNELGDRMRGCFLYIGVTKRRKWSIGQEKVGRMTSLAFHKEPGYIQDSQEFLAINEEGIKTGDTFRFYYSNSTTALSSAANVSNHMRSFNQGSNCTTGGDKGEVFGGLIFTSIRRDRSFLGQSPHESIIRQPNIDSLAFLNNFPGVTLGGIFCKREIRRGDSTLYVEEPQEQKTLRCCLHVYSAVYLIMSYSP